VDSTAGADCEGRVSERTYTVLFGFCGIGLGARGFARSSARVLGTEARWRSLGGIDIDPDACVDFERLTKSPSLCADVRTLEPSKLRDLAGPRAPDAVFGSAPCVGASGLVAEAKAAEQHYQELNQLGLIWLRTLLATWTTPPRLQIFENVPGLTRRAPAMLRELRKLLRGAGYILHEGTHDCGELGGLAQHRKRWLLVARRPESVPTLLYQPPKKRVRGVGEVLSQLPMPNDPSAGPMHRLPRVSWLTWVRLALIPAGGDWRDLPAQVALPHRENRHSAKFAMTDWDAPGGTVTGPTVVQTGAPNVGDPRLRDAESRGERNAYQNMYRVVRWDAPNGTVAGPTRPGSGAPSVADPRVHDPARHSREHNDHVYGVLPWNAPAHTIAGTTSAGNGPFSVADPRAQTGFNGSFGVNRWEDPAGVVTGSAMPSRGPFTVSDPRVSGEPHGGSHGVRPWSEPSGTVAGESHPSNGEFSLADPRLGCEPRNGAYGIVPWTKPSGTVTASGQHDNDEASVADPRIPTDWRKPPADPPPIIIALDGTWHRPMTTLELGLLQGAPAVLDGVPFVLTATTDALRRKHIGNAVPAETGEAIGRQMLLTLAHADAGQFVLSAEGGDVWVDPADDDDRWDDARPEEMADA
jgi:site-specific DNA-cytosine methylase